MRRTKKKATSGRPKPITSIAHEIKNSLAGISGAIHILTEGLPEDDPRREIINEVLEKIWRVDKLIKELFKQAKNRDKGKRSRDAKGKDTRSRR
jgi:nitrogen-specific signal transduction histidine kinase